MKEITGQIQVSTELNASSEEDSQIGQNSYSKTFQLPSIQLLIRPHVLSVLSFSVEDRVEVRGVGGVFSRDVEGFVAAGRTSRKVMRVSSITVKSAKQLNRGREDYSQISSVCWAVEIRGKKKTKDFNPVSRLRDVGLIWP